MSNLRNPQYDAFLNLVISYHCNLECDYCIAGFARKLVICDEPSELYTKTDPINISALKKTLNDSYKIYRISLQVENLF